MPSSSRAARRLIERGVIRFLYGRPLETLLATWGIALILQQAVRTYFGPNNREVGNPVAGCPAPSTSAASTITYNRLWIIVFSLVVFGALMLLSSARRSASQMRAVTQNRAHGGGDGHPHRAVWTR